MALHVTESRQSHLSDWLQLLAPQPGRLAYALRLALICALTALVVEIYQTPDAALTVYLVFFLNKPERMESLILTAMLLALITIVVGLVILMTMVVIDQPVWRVAAIAAISFGLLFMASASKLRPIGSTIALIIGYALDLLGTAHLGEIAVRGLLYAWLFVGIPAGVSIAINLLLAPSPRRLAERAMAERLRVAALLLSAPSHEVRIKFAAFTREGVSEIMTWLKLAGLEKTSPASDIEALRQAAESTTALLLLVEVLDRDSDQLLTDLHRLSIARCLDEMAAILEAGGYPVEILTDIPPDDPALSAPARAILADVKEALARFAEKPLPDLPPPPEEKKGGFFLPDAFSNAEHVRYALKTTFAAMFCYILYSLLDWPGIHTCFITCYIVSLGTTAETVEKLTLRLLGCLLGAAAGIAAIVYVVPALTSIEALMAIIFLGALVAAWVAAGGPRISYAGFQIAFAFFLCVIQGSAPAFDMVTARDRVIGILLGNIVVYLIFTNVWPVSLGQRIDPAITSLLRRLSAMLTASSLSARRALALHAQTELGHIESDLDLIKYEPPTIRPAQDWLTRRFRALHEIRALEAPLFLSAGREAKFSADLARRLERLADGFAATRSSFPENMERKAIIDRRHEDSPDAPDTTLHQSIDPHFRSLEHALAQPGTEERTIDAPA